MKRAHARFFVTCPRTLADRTAVGLRYCDSMLSGDLREMSSRYNWVLGRQFSLLKPSTGGLAAMLV